MPTTRRNAEGETSTEPTMAEMLAAMKAQGDAIATLAEQVNSGKAPAKAKAKSTEELPRQDIGDVGFVSVGGKSAFAGGPRFIPVQNGRWLHALTADMVAAIRDNADDILATIDELS